MQCFAVCVLEVPDAVLTCVVLRDYCGDLLSSFVGAGLVENWCRRPSGGGEVVGADLRRTIEEENSLEDAAMADELAATTEALRLDDSKVDEGLEEGEIVEKPVDRPAEVKKHPLEHSWTFWFDNPNGKQKQATWGSSLRPVYTFHTVEDFWCLYNNVLQPSKLIAGADFHCFKAGIEPKWEDPKCAHGGKWTAQPPRSGGKAALDTYWLHTLLAMIGEQFEEGDEICGAVVSVRRAQDKIAIWTKTASNEAAQVIIGKQWKDVLDYNDKLGYLVHEDAKRQDKGAKNRYNV